MNAHHPIARTVITADARKVSPADFMEMVRPGFHERQANERLLVREQCIRAIRAGNTYGWPPLLVSECKGIIADREALTDTTVAPMGDEWFRVSM